MANIGHLKGEVVASSKFKLQTYARLTPGVALATIYIEGDGFAYVNRSTASSNPTPKRPVSLELAAADPAPTVIYIARPCQYVALSGEPLCQRRYWTRERYAPVVLGAINEVIDHFKAKAGLEQLHLIGHSGGATIAALLSAMRDDVVALTTVAGNLDIAAFTRIHKVSPLTGSLNPIEHAKRLAAVPQRHWVGSDDAIVPVEIARSYHKALRAQQPAMRCSAIRMLAGVGHQNGWVDAWPRMLSEVPRCQ